MTMEGMAMEIEGTLYKTTHCKDCGMLFLVESGSLDQLCDICGKKKVLQNKKPFSTLRKANTLKGVLAKN